MDSIEEYKKEIILEMIKLGGSDKDISLISIEMVENAIRNNRKPEDIAWAIMQ